MPDQQAPRLEQLTEFGVEVQSNRMTGEGKEKTVSAADFEQCEGD
jgi:hypothetical protein